MFTEGNPDAMPVSSHPEPVPDIDCRTARTLVALQVGHDLPDAASLRSVTAHVEECSVCRAWQQQLLASQTVLTESRLMFEPHGKLWPRVAACLTEWERRPQFARFNVWIPTVVATAACLLLVAVATLEMQRHNGGLSLEMVWQSPSPRDLFRTDPAFAANHGQFPSAEDVQRWRWRGAGLDSRGLELQPARNRVPWHTSEFAPRTTHQPEEF